MKYCIALFVFLLSVGLSAQEFNVPEVLPKFNGPAELTKYLSNKAHYPAEAIADKIRGEVLVSFVVTENGEVNEARIEQNIGGGCGDEAIRLVKSSHKMWAPAENAGFRVPVRMNLSFKFNLSNVNQKGSVTVGDPFGGYGENSSAARASHESKAQSESEKVVFEKSETLFNFGVKNFGEGKYTKAKHYFTEVLKLKPDDKNARFNLALTYMKLEDVDSACAELDTLRKENYEDAIEMGKKICD